MIANYERPPFSPQPKDKPKLLAKKADEKAEQKLWRKRRTELITRDGLACKGCGAKHALDMHHLLRRSLGGDESLHNLIFLCRECHRAVHGHVLKFFWKKEDNRAGTCRMEWVK